MTDESEAGILWKAQKSLLTTLAMALIIWIVLGILMFGLHLFSWQIGAAEHPPWEVIADVLGL